MHVESTAMARALPFLSKYFILIILIENVSLISPFAFKGAGQFHKWNGVGHETVDYLSRVVPLNLGASSPFFRARGSTAGEGTPDRIQRRAGVNFHGN